MHNRFLRSNVLIALLALVSSVLAIAQTPSPADQPAPKSDAVSPRGTVDMLAEIKKSGKLRVGVTEVVPWAMHNKDGKLVGFSIDVARKLARDLGVEVDFHPVQFSYLIPDLLTNRYDIIVSGFSIKADRALLVNFSEPYNETDVTLAANVKTAGGFKKLNDFNRSNLKIGSLQGTTAEEMSAKLLPDAQLVVYTSDGALFDDLIKGKLDAAAADYPRPEIVAKLFPKSVTSPPAVKLSTFPEAFAVRRGDLDFINYLNSWIAAHTSDEWLDSRKTYWFRTMDWSKDL
jgi:polar amino acid transport system substrate-binding protein